MLVDTNILLRLILQDDTILMGLAKRVFNQPDKSCVVTSVILAEAIYVLRGQGYARHNTASAISELLEHPSFIYDEPWLERALSHYGSTNLDFADCYLLVRAKQEKRKLLTLDKAILKRLG